MVGLNVKHRRIQHAVIIAIDVLHFVNVDRMPDDLDVIPFSAIEIQDHVVTQAFHPVIVDIVVFAGHTVPVDGPVVFDVLEDDVPLGVDQRAEFEDVRAAAAIEYVVRFDRLIGEVRSRGSDDLAVRIVFLRIVVLIDPRFATVGEADQAIRTRAAAERVLTMSAGLLHMVLMQPEVIPPTSA